MSKRFPQKERIKEKKHFDTLFSDAQKIHSTFFIICYSDKQLIDRRFAFIASKKVGNSVYRNKAKRVLKELIRNHQHRINKKYDMIVIAKATCIDANYSSIEDSLLNALQEHNLWLS